MVSKLVKRHLMSSLHVFHVQQTGRYDFCNKSVFIISVGFLYKSPSLRFIYMLTRLSIVDRRQEDSETTEDIIQSIMTALVYLNSQSRTAFSDQHVKTFVCHLSAMLRAVVMLMECDYVVCFKKMKIQIIILQYGRTNKSFHRHAVT